MEESRSKIGSHEEDNETESSWEQEGYLGLEETEEEEEWDMFEEEEGEELEQPDMYGVSRIQITKPDEEMMEEDVSYTCNGAVYSRRILINDFLIEVDMV
jgi:hypothetical protein